VPICNLVSEFNGLVSKGSAAMPALLLFSNNMIIKLIFLNYFSMLSFNS